MAVKRPVVSDGDDNEFDQEKILKQNLQDLPKRPEIRGLWEFKFIRGELKSGQKENGDRWAMINIILDAVRPVGEDVEDIEYDPENPRQIYHRVFYTKLNDQYRFVDLAKVFGVEAGTLEDMLEDLRGTSAVAKATGGTDNFGRPETKLSSFRPVRPELKAVA